MEDINNSQTSVKRISGYLHRVIPIGDKTGKIISYALKPMLDEFKISLGNRPNGSDKECNHKNFSSCLGRHPQLMIK